jgi:dipeptidyl aminopeptidase/acylaminoacyl peptidase
MHFRKMLAVWHMPARVSTAAASGIADEARNRAARTVRQPPARYAPDGLVSEGLLVHPVHERAGTKHPLVIWHHGGPEGAINTGFFEGTDEGWPVGQLAAARGWYAFLPNYRGSDDLGTAHEHAIYQDPGAGPMSDVMAGLAAIERRGSIDTARECIGGHSYGGAMTAWIVEHDTRWRCAVLGDAVDWEEASIFRAPATSPSRGTRWAVRRGRATP